MPALVKTLSFDVETARALEKLAEKFGKSQSEIVRELIRKRAEEVGVEGF